MIQVLICGYKCSGTIERCIQSVLYKKSRVPLSLMVSIDRDDDGDWKKSFEIANYHRFVSTRVTKERNYLIKNTVTSLWKIGELKDDDIIALVDADDHLLPRALLKVYDVYRTYPKTLVTHGTYRKLSDGKVGKFNGQYHRGESFRTSKWRGGHLKTFRYGLWKRLNKSELVGDDWHFFRYCADRAIMIPLMEMAGHDRVKYIPEPIYVYNDLNPLRVPLTARKEQKAIARDISKKKPLERI